MIREPALLVHGFCRVGQRDGERREPVLRLWDTFRSPGEVRPIAPHTTAEVPKTLPEAGAFTALVAARLGGPGVHEAALLPLPTLPTLPMRPFAGHARTP